MLASRKPLRSWSGLLLSCEHVVRQRQRGMLIHTSAYAPIAASSGVCIPVIRPRTFATTPQKRATQIKPYLLADVGEGITECEIIKWFVTPGTVVQEFDPICEVQSDKASVEITSRYAGTVKSLMHKEGDVAKVGQPLCEIEMQTDENLPDATAAPLPETPVTETKSTEKTTETESMFQQVEMEGFTSSSTSPSSFSSKNGEILAIPAVRRLSKDHNVDLAKVNGTGKDGRITKQDVLAYLSQEETASSNSTPSSTSSTQTETIELTPVQRAMFKAMTTTLQTPHFAYSDEIDVTELDNVRKQLSSSIPESYRQSEVNPDAGYSKLTLLPLLVKAMSLALYEHPLFRSMLTKDETGGSYKLVRRTSHDISIALSSRVGLLTPCILGVQGQSIYDLSASIVSLQTRAASSKGLSHADLKPSGTITLSNIGAVGGGTYTHPLLPPTGQLAIAALGRSRISPRFASEIPSLATSDQDKIVRRLIMPVSFTADHRVVEGAHLAKLVNRWKQLVESPSLWLGLLH